MERDCFSSDSMHVAVPRAAGIDVHKMQVTATVRLCEPGRSDAAIATRVLGTDPPALRALTDWLGLPSSHFASVTKAILLPASSAILCPNVAADKR